MGWIRAKGTIPGHVTATAMRARYVPAKMRAVRRFTWGTPGGVEALS